MSEYIITNKQLDRFEIPAELFTEQKIVRCRDCKYGINDGELCAEGASDSWDWRNVEPDSFCAWGERAENFTTCKCGEDVELGNRESAVCPRCKRTVRA